MYMLLLLVLVFLILLYFVLDNFNLIINLFIVDLHQQKDSKPKKLTGKNLKKLEKQASSIPANADFKVEILQRYLNISAWVASVRDGFVSFTDSHFNAFKVQVESNLKDVRYVLNNLRDLFNKEDVVDLGNIKSNQTKTKKNKVDEFKKQTDQKLAPKGTKLKQESSKKLETKKVKETTPAKEEKKRVNGEEKKNGQGRDREKGKFNENEKRKIEETKRQAQKSETSVSKQGNPKDENDTRKDIPSQPTSKDQKKAKDLESEKERATSKGALKKKEESKEAKQIQEPKVKTKTQKKVNEEKRLNFKIEEETPIHEENDANEWKHVENKTAKANEDKNSNKGATIGKAGNQNVITLEKNSKGKKEITIKENEQSGVKTVLVKKTKQTVYKQTEQLEKVTEKKSGDSKENDKSIGSLSFEELELLVKSFSAKGQEKTDNLIDIIQEVQGAKKQVEEKATADEQKSKKFDSDHKEAEKIDFKVKKDSKHETLKARAITVGVINPKNLKDAKIKVDVDSNEGNVTTQLPKQQRKRSRSSSGKDELSEKNNDQISVTDIEKSAKSVTKNVEIQIKSEKPVEIDPVLEKLEKIKNNDFDQIGKLSFDELGKIVNALVSENLVPVPKFSDPPLYKERIRKPKIQGSDFKLEKTVVESKNISKKSVKIESSIIRSLEKGKGEKVVQEADSGKVKSQKHAKNHAELPEEVFNIEPKDDKKIQSNLLVQKNSVFSTQIHAPQIEIDSSNFPILKEDHFVDAQEQLHLQHSKTSDFLNYGDSDLSRDMILCEEIAVKSISELLEDDSESSTHSEQQDPVIESETKRDVWIVEEKNTDRTAEKSHPFEQRHLDQNPEDPEPQYQEAQYSKHQYESKISYDTREHPTNQAIQGGNELNLCIEEARKAVVQELKENFAEAEKRQIIDEDETLISENESFKEENILSAEVEQEIDGVEDSSTLVCETSFESGAPTSSAHHEYVEEQQLDENYVDNENGTFAEERNMDKIHRNLPEEIDYSRSESWTYVPVVNINDAVLESEESSVEIIESELNVDEERRESTPEDIGTTSNETENFVRREEYPTEVSDIVSNEPKNTGESEHTPIEILDTVPTETETPDVDSSEETQESIQNNLDNDQKQMNDALESGNQETMEGSESGNQDTIEASEVVNQESSETGAIDYSATEAGQGSQSVDKDTKPTKPDQKVFIRPVIKIDRCADEKPKPPQETQNIETRPPRGEERSSNKMVGQQQNEVRVLTLQNDAHQEGVHYRLKTGWTLQICLGETLFGRKVIVFTNIPEEGQSFQRTQYRTLDWANASGDDTVNYIRIPISLPGSFHYYFTFEGSSAKQGSGYLVVEPSLTLGGEPLPLDAIQCVTVLARCLGPFPTWDKKLQVAKETGYNMVHFTPIQELGDSNSCYSLSSQLDLNPVFSTADHRVTWDDVTAFNEKLRTEWQMLSLCDIVLNHTANETSWLREHPEASYNLVNSAHLKPAYLLDVMLQQLSDEVEAGNWVMNGVPRVIDCEDHLNALRHLIHTRKLSEVRIPELFSLDSELLVKQFQDLCRTTVPVDSNASSLPPGAGLRIVQDPQFRRLKSTIDLQLALKIYNVYRSDCFDEDSRIRRCVQEFKLKIDELNSVKIQQIEAHLNAAVDNLIAGVRYYRVSPDGPRHTEISLKCPLVYRYFTDYQNNTDFNLLEDINPVAANFIMAHNGWVMGANPLDNFASPESNTYLRRELIAWGDSVKLRFGDCPADNPWLWSHMRSYVEATARTFDGVRLDNCHSTPLPVAEYLLDAARSVKPQLYVMAELFTDSPEKDNIFVNRLGITSLVREAMSAWDSHELGRIVHRYGGEPIGAFLRPSLRPLAPSIAHALLLDLSHDNPCPITKRCVFDLLPSAALVTMSASACGSTAGYDTLVPHQIDVVEETRQYPEWDKHVNLTSGIIGGKRALNRLHNELGLQGYTQVFVDQVDTDIVAITRHHPSSHESIVLVAFTAFNSNIAHERSHQGGEGKGIKVDGVVGQVLLEAGLRHSSGDRYKSPDLATFARDPHLINGLTEYTLDLNENIAPSQASYLRVTPTQDGGSRLDFTSNFKPGCVLAVRITPIDSAKIALSKLSLVFDFSHNVTSLSLSDLNKVLYCCGEEDGGTYNVPNYGHLVYCGLQGILSLMSDVSRTNDLGHPVCANLRDGPWLMQYLSTRLKQNPSTTPLGDVLDVLFEPLNDIPRYLVPCYFHATLTRVCEALVQQCYDMMSDFVQDGSSFVKALALTSVQMGGIVASAPLPPLSSSLLPPLPPPVAVTCAAGLPHFSTGYMRNWGRDTFIALRGLFLLTGRYQEARFIILGFAGTLRHGLIPNLLDGGYNARYNCRDAVWWWLYTLQCYVNEAPNGLAILQDKVNRLFPTDDSEATSVDQPLYEVVQEAVERHFQGVVFRERNAGTAIDAHMVSQGFDNQIGVHPVTGFVFGGNQWNCGTWMDKMGSSERAGTKGRPASPRDGSAVELVGLSKATVRWLAELNKKGDYPYAGVSRTCQDGTRVSWTYEEWNAKIQASFEPHFWIPLAGPLAPEETRPDLVNRRGIYKDSYGASQPWFDYQLRCNYPIAMVVAPELFTPANALTALALTEATLLSPGMGIRTLDPGDWSYRGDYCNDNDSDDPTVAHGFNYHNGPEWLWPVGFYLRARLQFTSPATRSATIADIRSYLARHFVHLTTSPWRGLPELTNKEGKECPGSCQTQAWSGSTILEVLNDVTRLESVDSQQHQ
uniref:Glycogen debranching enzyme n=1 Tax=Cacopsylla melanoneura TaxID=428564 RepID=A0A8D8RVX4_9HEMI